MTRDAVIEQLADLEHQQWCHWAQGLLADEPGLSLDRASRWRRELIPYHDLPEDRKELDRVWPRRVLTLFQQGMTP